MSTDIAESDFNNQLVLISGESGTGKSVSLMNLSDPTRTMYLNCEAGKRLPFKSKFQEFRVSDPYQVEEGLIEAKNNPTEWTKVVIDTATFMMDMFESQYVLPSSNTQKAWGDYAQFWKRILQTHISQMNIPVIILAHTRKEFNELEGRYDTSVPIKGALKNQGIEAYFSTVVSTKRMPIKELLKVDPYDKNLLHITPQDEALGFKHVFQTSLTKATIGERIRSPMGLFNQEQLYMDNDAQLLLSHLHDYYS